MWYFLSTVYLELTVVPPPSPPVKLLSGCYTGPPVNNEMMLATGRLHPLLNQRVFWGIYATCVSWSYSKLIKDNKQMYSERYWKLIGR